MHIAIIGAGISGLMSAAYALQLGAKEITIIERAGAVASKASGANAAQLSYSYVNPLGQPYVLKALPQLMMGVNKGLRVEKWDAEFLIWAIQFLLQCPQSAFIRNRNKLLALSFETKHLIPKLLARTGLSLKRHSTGKLHLFHTSEGLADGRALAETLKAYAATQKELERAGAEALVRGMDVGALPFAGAMFAPDDETADCAAFCHDLAEWLKGTGAVRFCFENGVREWKGQGKNIKALMLEDGQRIEVDRVLICTGSGTNALLKPLGLSFPIYPIKGYTLEFEKGGVDLSCAVTDHAQKVVFVPYGGHILVSGMFHMAGHNMEADESVVAHIKACAKKRLPALKAENYALRIGLRPCTPDAQPIIRQAGPQNLFVNIGQGGYGWTLSASTAKKAAEMVMGAKPL